MANKVAGGVLLAILSSIAVPTAALAQLPKPASKTIVLGKSIGGVRPAMTLAAAQNVWGPGGFSEAGDACQESGRTSCIWKGRSATESARVRLANDGTIAGVIIIGGPASPLARLKTSKGFGIGTRVASLMKAYPGKLPSPVGLGAPIGAGSAFVVQRTNFYIHRTTGRVIAVGIGPN